MIVLLVAKNELQQSVHLHLQLSKVELQQLKKQHQFFCPQCDEPLQLKAGAIRIPHFSHYRNSMCETFFSDRESETHLLGKQHLFELFTQLHLSPTLEPYLPQIQQRPDLLLTNNSTQYAIEFQCSQLSFERFRERTNGYLSTNIIPIWIVSAPIEKLQYTGLQKIAINHTMAQYVQKNKGQHFLITYDVKSMSFYYISNIIHLNKLQYLAVIQTLPIKIQQFPFLIPEKICREKFEQLFFKILQFRNDYMRPRLLFSKKGVNDRFLRALYELRLTIDSLPNFLGIPINITNAFDEYCIEWQVQLFYFLKSHQLTPMTMNLKAINYFLQWAHIDVTKERKREVQQYLALLKQLKIEFINENVDKEQIIQTLYSELVAFG